VLSRDPEYNVFQSPERRPVGFVLTLTVLGRTGILACKAAGGMEAPKSVYSFAPCAARSLPQFEHGALVRDILPSVHAVVHANVRILAEVDGCI
jgi:hypothetical protein